MKILFFSLFLITSILVGGCAKEEQVLVQESYDPLVSSLVMELNKAEAAMYDGQIFRSATSEERNEFKVYIYRARSFSLKLNKDPQDEKTIVAFYQLLKKFEEMDFVERDTGVFANLIAALRLTVNHYAELQGIDFDDLQWTLYSHAFVNGIKPFKEVNTTPDGAIWEIAMGKFAKIGGRGKPTDNWLMSPILDLKQVKKISIKMNHTVRNPDWDKFQLLVSDNYFGADPKDSTWKQLQIKPDKDVPENKWFDLVTEELDLTEFAGKKIVIALRYLSDTENNTVWEVLSLELNGSGKKVEVEDLPVTYEAVP